MAKAIAEDLPANKETPILEIGPGHGAMTRPLLEVGAQLTAVEIDSQCVEFLKTELADKKNFSIVNADFLQFDFEKFLEENRKPWVTGNLPYNVSVAIVAKIIPHLSKTLGFMGMVQFEVAERICAQPCSRAYGSLSVLVSSYAHAKILRKISPEHFTPRPNVNSATIFLSPKENPLKAPKDFFPFVQDAFSQKRKRLANSLSSRFEKQKLLEALDKIGLSPNARAEELSPETFLKLYEMLKENSLH